MDDIRISVILPVYGVEKYIGQCIETLKAQKLDGLEFLFIDDCSPDNSAAIVEAAAAEDGRFHLIRQPRNGGPGAARRHRNIRYPALRRHRGGFRAARRAG